LQEIDAQLGKAVPQYNQLAPPMKAALLDAAYNLGAGVLTGNTSLHRDLASGNTQQLAQDLLKYNHDSNGNVLPGLDKRRHQEAAMLTAAQAPGGATSAAMPQGNSIAHTAQLGVDPAALTRMNADPLVPQAYKDATRDRLQSETTPKDIETPQGVVQAANTGQTGFVPKTQFVTGPTTTMAPTPEGGATVGNVTSAEGGTGFGPESAFGKMQQEQAQAQAAAGVAGKAAGTPGISLGEDQAKLQEYVKKGNDAAGQYAPLKSMNALSDLASPGIRGQKFDQATEFGKVITGLFSPFGFTPSPNMTNQENLQAGVKAIMARTVQDKMGALGGAAAFDKTGFDPTQYSPTADRMVADLLKQNLDVDTKMKTLAEEAAQTKDPAKIAELSSKEKQLRDEIVPHMVDAEGKKVPLADWAKANKPGGAEWLKRNEGKSVPYKGGKWLNVQNGKATISDTPLNGAK
jgi:hypothetical protein